MAAAARTTRKTEIDERLDKIDAYIEEFANGASLCRVVDNIWIGDLGAAANIASGNLVNFGAVFNASSYETWGVTYEHKYRALGIEYDTLTDYGSGFAIADAKMNKKTAGQFAIEMAAAGDVQPSKWIPSFDQETNGWKKIPIHATPIATESIFAHGMLKAADKISALVSKVKSSPDEKKKEILVHCYAGMNRSGSSIVAYLALHKNFTVKKAIEIVQEATMERRRVESLTNKSFNKALKALPAKVPAIVERDFATAVRNIKTMAAQARKNLYITSTDVGECFCDAQTKNLQNLFPRWACQHCNGPMRQHTVCGTCRRRCYCSRECQRKDYQRHVAFDGCGK